MALDRKDIRAKLEPQWHEALVRICDREGIDIGVFVEREIERVLSERIHQSILDFEAIHGLGITGKIREQLGIGKAGRK
jgi:hypothetical protein